MPNYDSQYLLAQMARGSYDNPPRNIAGWSVADKMIDPNTGFAACAYKNDRTGNIVIAYRGTNGKDDATADLAIAGIGGRNWDAQFTQGLEFAVRVKSNNPNTAISVTGHSLGGSLAQVASQAYGFHGVAFDPGGAANLIQSGEFKQWTQAHGLGAHGQGMPSNFESFVAAKSRVSHNSGAHIGQTQEFSSISGRDTLEVLSSKGLRLGAGGPLGMLVGEGKDGISTHSMDRIERTFAEAAKTGKLREPLPIIGQGEGVPAYAKNSPFIPVQTLELGGHKADVVAQTTDAVNKLCDAKGYPNHGGRDNMACYLANDLITQGAQGTGKFEAALGVDGKTISVREQINEFKDFIASADSNVIVNIPKAESLAKIAAYEAPAITQTESNPARQIGRA